MRPGAGSLSPGRFGGCSLSPFHGPPFGFQCHSVCAHRLMATIGRLVNDSHSQADLRTAIIFSGVFAKAPLLIEFTLINACGDFGFTWIPLLCKPVEVG